MPTMAMGSLLDMSHRCPNFGGIYRSNSRRAPTFTFSDQEQCHLMETKMAFRAKTTPPYLSFQQPLLQDLPWIIVATPRICCRSIQIGKRS
jgi:hypothetical protein